MDFRWLLAAAQPLLAADLARELRISPLLAQCLINRNLTDPISAAAFLRPRLKNLCDPFFLPNMEIAVARLFKARFQSERVVIFGDYDVDGVTSTALLLQVLRSLGLQVDTYLPKRLDEGYGLSAEAVENCLRKYPATLLLAVDCGSTATATIAALHGRGIDVLVLDHHQAPDPARPLALINPHCHSVVGARMNFRELCSVGLAFKLAHALVKRGRETNLREALQFDLRDLLDLVALGTIADVVPLSGENRIFVSAGLQRLNTTSRPGLKALKEVARCGTPVGVFEVGFQLAPRLNAAGRLETAEDSLRLLCSDSDDEARRLAEDLNQQNESRQKIERGIADEAIDILRSKFKPGEDYVIVEGKTPWHIGVVGVVASRLLNQFYRPTIIVGGDGDEWRGSGRSIAGFDLASALRGCSDLLLQHGGHSMAAGVSLSPQNMDAFRNRLNQIARREITPDLLRPELQLDAVLPLRALTFQCLRELEALNPTGQGNPPVALCASKLMLRSPAQRVGRDKRHVKMWVTDGSATYEAVWWGAGEKPLPSGTFDIAFLPQENHYNGSTSIQLKVLDWRPSEKASP